MLFCFVFVVCLWGQRIVSGVGSLLPPCESVDSNSGRQAWQQVLFATEPAYQLLFVFETRCCYVAPTSFNLSAILLPTRISEC